MARNLSKPTKKSLSNEKFAYLAKKETVSRKRELQRKYFEVGFNQKKSQKECRSERIKKELAFFREERGEISNA